MKKTILLLVTFSSVAFADTADSAFQRGQSAMKAGRVHEACDAYAQSEQLAARTETELALAACYEQDGKPASAARLYRAAGQAAKAAKLEARAPKLRFAISPTVQGVIVKVDGVVVSANEDALVDTGPHEVTATAPGFAGHASAPVDREKAILDVIVRMEPVAEPAPAPAAPEAPKSEPAATPAPEVAPAPMPAPEPVSHRKRNGIIVGAVGLGALVGAAVMFAESSSKFDDAQKLCPTDTCANATDLAKGHSLLSDGHTLRGAAIGTSIAGALLVAAGTYLWMTPSHEASHVSVQLDRGGAGVSYSARF